MKDTEVHSSVVRWLAGITGKVVIKSHQGGDDPALPYLMVNLLTTQEVRGHSQFDDWTEAGDDVTATPQIETQWHFSVHAYGPEPTDILRPVRAAAQLAQMNEPLMPGLVVHDLSFIRHVPDFVNNRWQPRAQMDLYLRGIVQDGFVVDVIEQFSFTHERT